MSRAGKRELLALLLKERGLTADRIGPRPAGAPAVVTSAQQRLWFLQQLEPDSPAYNLCGAMQLSGPLDVTALEVALTRLLARHEVLRTTYRAGADGAEPVLREEADTRLPVTDLPEAGAEEVDAAVRELARRPFDLDRELPLRPALFRLGAQQHLLVLVAHHIACDERSWRVLVDEVATEYATAGSRSAGAAPPLQYADVAWWLREELAAGRLDRQRDYWRGRLTPAPEPLPLPTDFPRPRVPSPDGGREELVLTAAEVAALRSLATAEGATPFMVLLAVLTAVLHRWTGATDVAVGSPAMNRGRPELEPVIGNLSTLLVLRSDLSGDPTFRTLLGRVRETCTEAYAHQDVPFEQVVEDLRPPRQPGRAAFSDVLFSMRRDELAAARLPGLELAERPASPGTARFDLALEAMERTEGLRLSVTYRTDLFRPDTAARLLGHVRTLLIGAAADPDSRLGDLPLLTDAEQEQLTAWSRGPARPADPRSLVDLVEEQVDRTPDGVALACGEEQLTYAELNRRANRLARRLRAAGVERDRLVGIFLDRSVEQVVAVLAVLKAGGAFLPLEPSLPEQRLRLLVEHARPTVVLTGGGRTVPGGTAIDVDAAALAAEDETNLAERPAPADLVYVVYTSGSTGVPKGAQIEHRNLVNRMLWQPGFLGLTDADAILYKTPLSFDVGVNELVLPLVAGARLVVAPPAAAADLELLRDLVRDERVTFGYFVASVLSAFLDLDGIEVATASLRHLWCGGEVLTPELLRRIRKRMTVTAYNGYGPAETTIGVTCRAYPPGDDEPDITIGRPNPGVDVHVLDERLGRVPVGVPGELCVGGAAVGRGYLHDPAQTDARFVPDPYRGSGRLYRTGDRVRLRPDGQIEFLGRVDNQVKVRGYRVELEEVEAALAAHPDVRLAAVAVRPDAAGGTQLAGYCVPRAPGAVTAAALREHLRGRLPDYMVPTAWLVSDALPTTSSGKVDRGALPAVAAEPPAARPQPRSARERLVAEAWAAVLGVDGVGRDDNFFDLGGHSLLLIQVQKHLRDRAVDVSVVDLFTYPTVAALARHLDAGAVGDAGLDAELDRSSDRAARQRAALSRRRPGVPPGGARP